MNSIEYEAQRVCIRLHHGWAEKNELPLLANDPVLYREVQDRLGWLGYELIDRPDCPWYVIRILPRYDGISHYSRRFRQLQSRHFALLLILYAKLLLPRRAGHVGPETELSVTFQQLYQSYGHKFVTRRKVISEGNFNGLLKTLVRLGFIVKRRHEVFQAGPAMYMLDDEVLTDIAEESLHVLFGLEKPNNSLFMDDLRDDPEQKQ